MTIEEDLWLIETTGIVTQLKSSMSLKGVDIFQFNDAGQISDFEVMVRPANGLQALGAAMAKLLASAAQ